MQGVVSYENKKTLEVYERCAASQRDFEDTYKFIDALSIKR